MSVAAATTSKLHESDDSATRFDKLRSYAVVQDNSRSGLLTENQNLRLTKERRDLQSRLAIGNKHDDGLRFGRIEINISTNTPLAFDSPDFPRLAARSLTPPASIEADLVQYVCDDVVHGLCSDGLKPFSM